LCDGPCAVVGTSMRTCADVGPERGREGGREEEEEEEEEEALFKANAVKGGENNGSKGIVANMTR